jgi:EmrB/QacA subfamily drug resistance transporter
MRKWSKRLRFILVVIGIAQLMVVLDATIVNIALPSAQNALHFSNSDRQWIVTGYSLAFGSMLLLGGKISDLFGRKVTFIAGLIGFAVASAIGGAATGFPMLVTARAIQGLFGALLAPAALALLTTTFTNPKERGKAFGIYGAIAGGGGAVGMLLGGVLTEYLDWRWCLYINLIFAVIAVIGGMILLRQPARGPRPRLDLLGTVLASVGLFAMVYGFSNAETHGWSAPLTWGCLVASGVLLAGFVWWQGRSHNPLLPMRVVLDRNRGGSFLSVFLVGIGMFAVFLFLTYYLQETLGYSPVRTGLAFLPMIGALMVTATTATAVLLPRMGPKFLVAIGMVVGGLGMAWLTRLGLHSGYAGDVLPPLIVAGLGIGLAMAPAMNTAILGVAPRDAGVASATVNTMQQVGGSIGVAVLNTIAATAATSYATAHAAAAKAAVVATHSTAPLNALKANALLHSYSTAFWWASGILIVGGVLCGLILRRGVPVQDPSADPVIPH